ncbi:hypothetical protein GCM10020227_30500 [Streptomyces flavovirens]
MAVVGQSALGPVRSGAELPATYPDPESLLDHAGCVHAAVPEVAALATGAATRVAEATRKGRASEVQSLLLFTCFPFVERPPGRLGALLGTR